GGSSGGSCFAIQALNGVKLVGRREVGIPERHRQRLVAEQLLDRPKVDASHHQTARERVAEGRPKEPPDGGRSERRHEYPPNEVARVERCLPGTAREHVGALQAVWT